MFKVSIFNIEEFLQVVNDCSGPINMLAASSSVNINQNTRVQDELRLQHRKSDGYLRLSLDAPNPKDYFKMVYLAIAS